MQEELISGFVIPQAHFSRQLRFTRPVALLEPFSPKISISQRFIVIGQRKDKNPTWSIYCSITRNSLRLLLLLQRRENFTARSGHSAKFWERSEEPLYKLTRFKRSSLHCARNSGRRLNMNKLVTNTQIRLFSGMAIFSLQIGLVVLAACFVAALAMPYPYPYAMPDDPYHVAPSYDAPVGRVKIQVK